MALSMIVRPMLFGSNPPDGAGKSLSWIFTSRENQNQIIATLENDSHDFLSVVKLLSCCKFPLKSRGVFLEVQIESIKCFKEIYNPNNS